jgi:DNA (cytosine-5)-methyltransferase 1
MAIYYNEIDPYAAQWLRNLAAAREIPMGVVDERSIREVSGAATLGVHHAHFFAGIGGWPLALKLAGWPDLFEVWTGSCPCQPFSHAGKRRGKNDPRHLWPEFLRLITERRPATIFGEQVASPAGRAWVASVRADLEVLGYAVGTASLCAAGIGAPHGRSRIYWVAHTNSGRLVRVEEQDEQEAITIEASRRYYSNRCGGSLWASAKPMEGADGSRRLLEPGVKPLADGLPSVMGRLHGYGNAIVPALAEKFVRAFLESKLDRDALNVSPERPKDNP